MKIDPYSDHINKTGTIMECEVTRILTHIYSVRKKSSIVVVKISIATHCQPLVNDWLRKLNIGPINIGGVCSAM